MRAEVPDPLVDVQLAVGADEEEAVEARRSPHVGADAHPDARDLRAVPLAAEGLLPGPVELLGSDIDRLADEGARRGRALLPERRVVRGRVHLPDLDPVDPQFARRLVDQRLEHGDDLRAARRPLGRPRRRVRVHGDAAEAHRVRLVHEVGHIAGLDVVARPAVRPVVLDDVEVDRRDLPVVAEPHLRPGLESGPAAPDVRLLVAVDPQHHRPPDLLREKRRDLVDRRTPNLGPEAAAAVLADEDEVPGVEVQLARHGAVSLLRALRGPVQVAAAVVPVRHGAAGLHRVVGQRLVHHRVLEHVVRFGEGRGEVAVVPGEVRLAHRQPALGLRRVEVRLRPLHFHEFPPALAEAQHVALESGVRTAGAEAMERVDRERKRLEVEVDRLDRVRRRRLVDRRQREDRLAHVLRLIRERRLAGRVRLVHLAGAQDPEHAGHGERPARVHAAHPRVRHGAQEELGEDHPLRLEVLRVLGSSRDFRAQVRRRNVLSDQRHCRPPLTPCAARIRRRAWRSSGFCCSRRSGRDCRTGRTPSLPGWRSDSR